MCNLFAVVRELDQDARERYFSDSVLSYVQNVKMKTGAPVPSPGSYPNRRVTSSPP